MAGLGKINTNVFFGVDAHDSGPYILVVCRDIFLKLTMHDVTKNFHKLVTLPIPFFRSVK